MYAHRLRLNAFPVLFLLACLVSHLGTRSTAGEAIPVTHPYLRKATRVETIRGDFEEKFRPSTAPGLVFDARRASFLNENVKWGMISVTGDPHDIGMFWLGGYVYTKKPWDASWDDHKDLDGPTRNSAAIAIAATNMTVSGLHYFNVHDGVRIGDAMNWVVEHNWGEYIRDDCIENDHLRSGRVSDCLFDGCYTGISTRPSGSDTHPNGTDEVVELDRVLLRLQAMPYPYKWQTKKGIVDARSRPYTGSGTPFGHGNFFKLTDEERNPHFSIKNSIFLAVHLTEASKLDFPPESLIDVCENNIIIWLGPGSYPGKLPDSKFPDGVRIVTGEEGRDLWREKVTDWHARHPSVGSSRKPSEFGSLLFPETF